MIFNFQKKFRETFFSGPNPPKKRGGKDLGKIIIGLNFNQIKEFIGVGKPFKEGEKVLFGPKLFWFKTLRIGELKGGRSSFWIKKGVLENFPQFLGPPNFIRGSNKGEAWGTNFNFFTLPFFFSPLKICGTWCLTTFLGLIRGALKEIWGTKGGGGFFPFPQNWGIYIWGHL